MLRTTTELRIFFRIDGDTVTGTDESPSGIGDQRNFGIYVSNTDTLAGDVPRA